MEPWNFTETLKVTEEIKKDIVAKGGKIYELNDEEKIMYMKDVKTLEPQIEEVSKETGRKFMVILENYR